MKLHGIIRHVHLNMLMPDFKLSSEILQPTLVSTLHPERPWTILVTLVVGTAILRIVLPSVLKKMLL